MWRDMDRTIATKADLHSLQWALQADIQSLRHELKSDFRQLRYDAALLRKEMELFSATLTMRWNFMLALGLGLLFLALKLT